MSHLLDDDIISQSIAIIGVAGRFPGAENVEKFWKNISEGVESILFLSEEDISRLVGNDFLSQHPRYVKAISVMPNVDCFDANFFGITPGEAEITDPQHRHLIECALEAFENGGYNPFNYTGKTGVFVGVGAPSYLIKNLLNEKNLNDHTELQRIFFGNDKGFSATKVSYELNLTGPSLVIDTACSSSLSAVHYACKSLLMYECDMALAGGSSVNLFRSHGYIYEEGGIESPDGHCRPFDKNAKGTVFGSGVGLVLLKRLEDALVNKDYIYAVIRGSAINNDGALKPGYSAPSVKGQAEVISEALAYSGVKPETISYIEAHGTGTVLGDPIEVAALKKAFNTEKRNYCAIGSVKSNIGHLDVAAGIAGLIKTTLALKKSKLPPTLHYTAVNPQIDFDNSPFFVNTKLVDWSPKDFPKRAGVSSFGIGGTNVHVLLEESPTNKIDNATEKETESLLLLSAKTDKALDRICFNLANHLKQSPDISLGDVAYTLQVGRANYKYRYAFIAKNVQQAISKLSDFSSKDSILIEENQSLDIVFSFLGESVSLLSFIQKLYFTNKQFQKIFQENQKKIELLSSHDFLDIFENTDWQGELYFLKEKKWLKNIFLFVVEYSLVKYLKDLNIVPSTLVGFGLGEYVAVCVSEMISFEDCLDLLVDCSKHTSYNHLEIFQQKLSNISTYKPKIPYYSVFLKKWIEPIDLYSPDYWIRAVCGSIDLDESMQISFPKEKSFILNIGSSESQIVKHALKENLFTKNFLCIVDNHESNYSLLSVLRKLWISGISIDWNRYNSCNIFFRTPLPSYPFEKERYWLSGKVNKELNSNYNLDQEIKLLIEVEEKLIFQFGFYGKSYYDNFKNILDELCASYIGNYFTQAITELKRGEIYTKNFLMQTLKIQEKFKKFFNFFLNVLEEDKYIKVFDETVEIINPLSAMRQPRVILETLNAKHPSLEQLTIFLHHCATSYNQALSGDISAINVLFPNGDTSFLEKTFKEILSYSNYKLCAELLKKLIIKYIDKEKGRTIKILEVGGGKGELCKIITPALIDSDVKYYFTDIGTTFIRNAQRNKVSKLQPEKMEFLVYDISKDPEEQELDLYSFDIIIGFDVVHATESINKTLENLKKLLKKKGVLCIIETVTSLRWIEMIWGLTDGWWCFKDEDSRKLTPLMSVDQWKLNFELLFDSVQILPSSAKHQFETDYALIIGQYNQEITDKHYFQINQATCTEEKNDNYSSIVLNHEIELLSELWKDIFGIKKVGINESFYELGGDSLIAAEMVAKIRKIFDVDFPIKSLFENPTIEALHVEIKAIKTNNNVSAARIKSVQRTGKSILSYSQQALWFSEQFNGVSATYNIPAALELTGALNVAALVRSIQVIFERHEILRANFKETLGQPELHITEIKNLNVPILSVTEKAAYLTIKEFVLKPFNISNDCLFRTCILHIDNEHHILLVNMHHIVSDGWSLGILIEELAALYQAFSQGKEFSLPIQEVQYIDYIYWQQEWCNSEVQEKQLTYWKKQLDGLAPLLNLPLDFERPLTLKMQGAVKKFQLSKILSKKLIQLAKDNDATLFMILLTGFYILLYQCTKTYDIPIGTTNANRGQPDLEKLVGIFVNQLVLRANLKDNLTFTEFLHQVCQTAFSAYEHQDLPFFRLVGELKQKRQLNYSPLFQVLFVLQKLDIDLDLSNLRIKALEIDDLHPKFDISLFMEETEDGLIGSFIYNAVLFKESTILKMEKSLIRIWEEAVNDPSKLINSFTNSYIEHEFLRNNMENINNLSVKSLREVKRKTVKLNNVEEVKLSLLGDKTQIRQIEANFDNINYEQWLTTNEKKIEEELLKYGGVLFRGFCEASVSNFEKFSQSICRSLFTDYGDLPPEQGSAKVYKSTPYPSNQPILFHNESSHLNQWPIKQFFCCIKAASEGGETPIVDCRRVYNRVCTQLNKKIVEKLIKKGLLYVRNFVPAIDVSWQNFYRTEDPLKVEEICRLHGTNFEWDTEKNLRTYRLAQAVIQHPKTNEMSFFNQISLHHISCVDVSTRSSLLSIFGEKKIPRNVYYGDGEPIEEEVVQQIRNIFKQESFSFPWQEGDILLLDNILMAHGREPFVGDRKIIVAMGEMMDASDKIGTN